MPLSRLNDMVHRILRTEFALGVFDRPAVPRPVNPFTGAVVAQHVAEESIVLLKNAGDLLPLRASALKSIAVIGSHADAGVLSGGGSDQVSPAGGNAVPQSRGPVWHPSPPLAALRAKVPNARVQYDAGTDVATAAKLAAAADVAIVFVNQPTTEGRDVPNLTLPDGQDELVSRVAAANSHTVVVLETGGPVLMPWVNDVRAVLEAWYPGIRGGEAIANILFGEVNPSAKLPVTFPKSESDLPHVTLPAPPAPAAGETRRRNAIPFDITYSEGLKVGYKWFDAEGKEPLLPFGFGLAYTTYAYSELKITEGPEVKVTFSVRNTGPRAGAETAQVYVSLPPSAGEPPKRLAAWDKVQLAPGESKTVTLTLDRRCLSVFSVDKDAWELVPGEYKILVGGSSRNTPLTGTVQITDAR